MGQWSRPRDQEHVGVWPASGKLSGKGPKLRGAERAVGHAPLAPHEPGCPDGGGVALLPPPKALGLMAAAGRGRDMIVLGPQRKRLPPDLLHKPCLFLKG